MNIWTLYSFFAGLINFILGVYVCRRNPGKTLNRFFALTAFSFALWGISEFGQRISDTPEAAFGWIMAGGPGWCFMMSFYLHFAIIFARKENYLKNIFGYLFLYLPPILFLYFFWTTNLIYKHEIIKMYYGYTCFPGKFAWAYSSYYTILYFFAISLFIYILRKGTSIEKRQVKPILWGYTIAWLIGTISNVIFPLYGILLPELGTGITIVWAGSTFYSIFRHKLFITPTKEREITASLMFNLEKGNAYFTKEENSAKAYKIFIDQISHGIPGLCFSKFQVEKIREKYKILYTPIIWITFKDNDNSTISPKDIDIITSTILDFIEKTNNPIIFIDCFYEIRAINGRDRAMIWLDTLKNICREKEAILLFSISSPMFTRECLTKIEQAMQEIR
ncbi:MAG: DUF835 domain-containing protein [bacterium]|nr:DUF835 domain-containing protein [bacterium]